MGTPYPRIFLQATMPTVGEDGQAEIGDFWLDTNYDDNLDPESTEPVQTWQWCDILGKPTTLSDFGLMSEVTQLIQDHTIFFSEIKGTPPASKADGGNSDSVGGKYPGTGANNILLLDSQGHIPASCVGQYMLSALGIYVQASEPTQAQDGAVWLDTTSGHECLKAKVGSRWVSFGAVWK